MPPETRLIVCPSCACHAKLSETHCPSCGARLRPYDGWIAPAAAVVAMGLTTATCSDGVTGGSGAGGEGGMGSMSSMVSQSTDNVGAAYVVSSTVDVGPGPGTGPGGAGGAGGGGGAGGAAGTGGAGGAGGSGG